MRRQESKCASCGRLLSRTAAQLDHVPRIHESPKQGLQWLCTEPCHREKSLTEQQAGNTYSIQSRFSPHAKALFRDIPPPQPYVLHLSDSPGKGYPSCWQLDAIKCRSNAWKYSSSDFSVFCVLDSILPRTQMELADWQWIDCGKTDTPGKVLAMMPYLHAGWYFRAATAYLLDRKKIR